MGQSRDQIIAAAAAIFSQCGYHAAAIDAIAAAAGVAKGTIYYHFSGKADLFKSVVVEGLAELTQLTRKHMAADQPLKARLYHVLEDHVTLYLDYPDMARVVFREAADGLGPEYLIPIRKAKAVHLSLLAELLDHGSSKALAAGSGFAAAGIFSLLDGACSYYLEHEKPYGKKELVDSIYRLVNTGLGIN